MKPQFISLDQESFEIQTWRVGDEHILLVHEGLGSVSTWREFPQLLSDATGCSVTAWSRLGYGRSSPLPESRHPNYMHLEADMVPRIMSALGIKNAHLLGHSDGASISLIVAARYPRLVNSLILEAPHVFVESVTVQSIAAIRDVYKTGDLKSKLARHHERPDAVFWAWNNIWLDKRFLEWNIEDYLPLIQTPTMLIQGRDDEYGTEEQLDRIARSIKSTRRLMLDSCGHAPHRDQAEAVIAGIERFIHSI